MDVPLELSFRKMDACEAVEAKVRERFDKLETYFGRINSCRVVLEASHRHHSKGKVYHVRIEFGVPSQTLFVDRDPGRHHAHENVYMAVRGAFDAARRRLEDHARNVAGRVKTHEALLHGTVSVLNGLQGYGIAAMPDGQQIYFHRNSEVNHGFAQLEVGDEVGLVVATKGPAGLHVHADRQAPPDRTLRPGMGFRVRAGGGCRRPQCTHSRLLAPHATPQ